MNYNFFLREFQQMENDKLAKNINNDLANENLTIDDLLILYGTQLFEKDYFKKYFKYQNFKGEVKKIWSGINKC